MMNTKTKTLLIGAIALVLVTSTIVAIGQDAIARKHYKRDSASATGTSNPDGSKSGTATANDASASGSIAADGTKTAKACAGSTCA